MRTIIKTLTTFTAAVAIAWTMAPEPVYTQQAGVIGSPVTVAGIDKPVRIIKGRFTNDVTLTSDTYWVLRGAVFIGNPPASPSPLVPASSARPPRAARSSSNAVDRSSRMARPQRPSS